MPWTPIATLKQRLRDGFRVRDDDTDQILDNQAETAPAKAQAAGDMFAATGPNRIARIPRPTGRKVFTYNEGQTLAGMG